MESSTEKTVLRDTHIHEEKHVGDAASTSSSENGHGAEHNMQILKLLKLYNIKKRVKNFLLKLVCFFFYFQ
jgi:hypothetical protein